MPTRAAVLSQLADVFAELYVKQESAMTMAASAGLRLSRISLYAQSIATWHAILEEAEIQGRTSELITRASQQYPTYAPLDVASRAYAGWVAAGRPDDTPVAVVHPDAQVEISRQDFEPRTVLIPAGPFLMNGAPGSPAATPPHRVDLPAFRIGKVAVTNREYLLYVQHTGNGVAREAGWIPAHVGQVPRAGTENEPVVGISWDEAVAYCRWLRERTKRSYRLPTEAEWEKAASWVEEPAGPNQAGQSTGAANGSDELDPARKRTYPWGSTFDATHCNGLPAQVGRPTPVGHYSPQGDSAYGCADMAGNVWEWTHTWWGRERAVAEYTDPYRPDDGRERAEPLAGAYREFRIARGGSFRDRPERLTCTARARFAADSRDGARGFRVAMTLGA